MATAASKNDSLGYDVYAKTLWARIEQAVNRDDGNDEHGKPKVLGDDPLVVGIFGEWGAGKSFLLNAIRNLSTARLAEQKTRRENDPGDMLTIPVWFQAWKYEHEEYLHVPLLLHVMNALKDALREPPSLSAQVVDIGLNAVDVAEKIAKPTGKLLKVANAAFPIVQKILGSVSLFGFQLNIPDELGEWLETAAGAVEGAADDKKDDASEKKKKAEKERKDPKSHVTTATRDGLYFYRIHELLAALTRPGKYEGRKDLFEGAKVTKETRINFVVFVDDLDRCLPEKAVAVLELIKTVFNVESFAFVLALDDEVIERGIGHRYKDYAFGNKKSEMPITGFEYLEKIVHLPFRLPALTREDALLFIKQREQKLLDGMTVQQRAAYQPQPWFSGVQVGRLSSSADEGVPTLHLSHLLVNSFDAYVPRKLDRAVELFHHVAKVAAERGRPLSVSTGGTDVRIVLALVLIQLFQPELFRCLRRTGTGFDQLRDAFKPDAYKNVRLSSQASDYELLDWACYGPDLRANSAALAGMKDSLSESQAGVPTSETEGGLVNHLAVRNKAARLPTSLAATSAVIANVEKSLRHSSQRVRLPIVEKMLEHRAAQRHVFDVLKLFAALEGSRAFMPLPDESVKPYFSWLALNPQADAREALPLLEAIAAPIRAPDVGQALEPEATDIVAEVSDATSQTTLSTVVGVSTQRVRIPEIAAVFGVLTSLEPREQAEVANRAGLRAGQIIDSASAAELSERGARWLVEPESSASAGGTSRKALLLRGLQYLAPHLAPADAASLWALVSDAVKLPELPNELVTDPPSAALYADVRAALGQDNRFDPERPYFMKERFTGHSEEDEPIPGFVRIPDGKFAMGHHLQHDNLPRDVLIDKPFYLARTLTTVAQYARFIKDRGYDKEGEKFWDKQGLEWINGRYISEINEMFLPERLASRTTELRRMPSDWSAQLAHRNRPVTGITWFEARAYARWLDDQMSIELKLTPGSEKYQVMLPTEAQWERAARAESLTRSHAHRWPWGDDEKVAAQHANTKSAGIGHLSTVGVFAPNAIGLYDMAGNAWQWTDSLYVNLSGSDFPHVEPNRDLAMHKDNDKCDRPAYRGGGSGNPPESAGCSSRGGALAGNWDNNVGLRVVLS